MKNLEDSLYEKLVIKYQNTECDCNDERICSPCRSGEFSVFAKVEILKTASFVSYEEFKAYASIYQKLGR